MGGGGRGTNISSEDERTFCINYYHAQYVSGKYVNDEVKNELTDHCFVFVYRVARIFSRWEGGVVLWLANLNFRNIDFSL